MKTLDSSFVSIFGPKLTSMSFNRKKNVFHRLYNNQIIQICAIKKFRYSFTIQYDIVPLCSGAIFELPLDENRIGDLLGSESLLEWEINEDIEKNLLEAYNKCEKYLFNWFEYVKDYKTYYDFVLKRHEIMLSKLSSELSEHYKSIYSDYLKVPNAVGFYEVSLFLGEYTNAVTAIESRLRQNIFAVETNKRHGIEPTGKALNKQKELMDKLNETKNFQKGICSPDKLLKNNESITLHSYLQNF